LKRQGKILTSITMRHIVQTSERSTQ